MWDDQDVYVEIWTEKDAITAVAEPVTLQYDVQFVVAKGFASETFLWEAAEAIMEANKPTFVYQLGDHDPSGVMAFDKVAEKLCDMVPDNIPLEFERIAVTPAQIDAYSLPTRPTKNSKHGNAEEFGDSIDVDALDSNTLRELVRETIESHIDNDALAIIEAAEASERDILRRIANEHGNADTDDERQIRRAQREAALQRRNAEREARRAAQKSATNGGRNCVTWA